MRLFCERTNCYTGKVTKVEVIATLEYYASNLNSWWVKLDPGVTGYESAPVDSLLKWDGEKGWYACAGTQPVGTAAGWDSLFVPVDELHRLLDFLRLIKPLLDRNKSV